MNIQHTDNRNEGSFYVELDGKKEAELTYSYKDNDTIDIDHTEVKASLQGQGIGKALIEEAVAFMRAKNLKAMTSCSYAKSVFEKNPAQYQDVIK